MLEVCFIPRNHFLITCFNNATDPEYISCYGCAWSYTSRLLFVDIVSASVWVLSVERVPWKEFILYTWLQKEVFCAGCGAKVKVRDSPEHLMIIQRREEKAWRRSEPPGDQSENILHCLHLSDLSPECQRDLGNWSKHLMWESEGSSKFVEIQTSLPP